MGKQYLMERFISNIIQMFWKKKETGFLERPVQEKDYIAGASPIAHEIRIFDGNWIDYATDFEYQKQNGFETMSCVSQSAVNSIQMQINWMIDNDKLSKEAMIFLFDNNYLVDGHLQCSKRFIAILSETTPQGNYLTKVAQTIRDFGLVPEYLMEFEGSDWDTYYDKEQITEDLFELGKQFASYFLVQYEWVITPNTGGLLEEQRARVLVELKHTPLQIAKTGHATDYYNGVDQVRFGILDSYHPFLKDKKWSYDAPWILKILVTPKSEYTVAQVEASQSALRLIMKNRKTNYFWRPEANGEAYLMDTGGTFKYLKGIKCPLFDSLILEGYLIPISEEQWSKVKASERK